MSTKREEAIELLNNLNLGAQKAKLGETVLAQGPAVPDSEETTSPTVAEFNALLASLRKAGVIAE